MQAGYREVIARSRPSRVVENIWKVDGKGKNFECKRDWVDVVHCLICLIRGSISQGVCIFPGFKNIVLINLETYVR